MVADYPAKLFRFDRVAHILETNTIDRGGVQSSPRKCCVLPTGGVHEFSCGSGCVPFNAAPSSPFPAIPLLHHLPLSPHGTRCGKVSYTTYIRLDISALINTFCVARVRMMKLTGFFVITPAQGRSQCVQQEGVGTMSLSLVLLKLRV